VQAYPRRLVTKTTCRNALRSAVTAHCKRPFNVDGQDGFFQWVQSQPHGLTFGLEAIEFVTHAAISPTRLHNPPKAIAERLDSPITGGNSRMLRRKDPK